MGNLKEELLAIREKRGQLTAEIVLEEAASKRHPLHNRFTWDDTEAAHKWRLTEAGRLLRVTFSYTNQDGRTAQLRSFWAVRETEEGAGREYLPIEEVAEDPIAKTLMVQQMRRDWKRFKNRYMDHTEFLQFLSGELDVLMNEENNGTDG